VFRHGQFADIVQQRRRSQRFDLIVRKADLLADFQRIGLHPLQMLGRG
jgi:hypothetical protein